MVTLANHELDVIRPEANVMRYPGVKKKRCRDTDNGGRPLAAIAVAINDSLARIQTSDNRRACGFKATDSFWMRASRSGGAVLAESDSTMRLQPGILTGEALIL